MYFQILIDNLPAFSGGGVNGGERVHSLRGLPRYGDEAIDRLGQLKFEGKGDGVVSGVATMREKHRDAGEESCGEKRVQLWPGFAMPPHRHETTVREEERAASTRDFRVRGRERTSGMQHAKG